MPRPIRARLQDIADAIIHLDRLLAARSAADLAADPIAVAAFERFLEIISEASRHVPEAWKAEHPEIPWRRVADLGNWLRHAYQNVDAQLLWELYVEDIPPLKLAVIRLLTRPTDAN